MLMLLCVVIMVIGCGRLGKACIHARIRVCVLRLHRHPSHAHTPTHALIAIYTHVHLFFLDTGVGVDPKTGQPFNYGERKKALITKVC